MEHKLLEVPLELLAEQMVVLVTVEVAAIFSVAQAAVVEAAIMPVWLALAETELTTVLEVVAVVPQSTATTPVLAGMVELDTP